MYAVDNHQKRALIIVPAVFTAIAIVLTALRVYARRLKNAKVLADDYLCIAACILSVALLGGDIAMVVNYGGGGSVMDLKKPSDMITWVKILIITYLIWCAAVCMIQLAILFLYRRLFFVVEWFRKACYILMGLVFAWFVAAWVSDLALCQPVEKLWNLMMPGKCGDGKMMCNAVGLVHAILDFFILMIPMPLIWNLRITTGNKVFLSILLLCGVFATIASVLRLDCLINLTHYTQMDLMNYMWLPLIYHFVEVPVAIICCCMPALPPVVEKVKLSPFGSYALSMFSKVSLTSMGSSKKDDSEFKSKGTEGSAGESSKLGSIQVSESGSQRRGPSDELHLATYEYGEVEPKR